MNDLDVLHSQVLAGLQEVAEQSQSFGFVYNWEGDDRPVSITQIPTEGVWPLLVLHALLAAMGF